LKYIKKILKKLSEDPVTNQTPTIVFARDPKCNLNEFKLDDLSCYGMFTSIDCSSAIKVFEGSHALQGNLDPKILLEEDSVIKESVLKILSEFKDFPGYIFNLGHGITPDINPDKVKVLVEAIRESGS
jgi:uroporphyrinogen decarboxylase